MKSKHTTVAATAVATIALAGLLAGCSSGGGSTASPTASTDPGANVKEITVAAAQAPWLPSYQKVVADYEAKTGVKVDLKVFPFAGLQTQEANAAQSGSNAFDVMLVNEQWVGQFYDSKWLQPLKQVDQGFTWPSGVMRFDGVGQWDSKLRTTTDSGEPYALPINGNIHVFMYRTDLYSKLGLKAPATWDQVIANGQKAKNSGDATNGYVLRGVTPTYDFDSILYSYGGKWFKNEGKGDWTPAIDSSATREALTTWKKLAALGPASPQSLDQAGETAVMQGGNALQGAFVAAVAPSLEDQTASSVAGKIGYTTMPGGTPVAGTWVVGVPSGLPKDRTSAAWKFMSFVTSKAEMQKWAGYGGITTRTDITTDRPELKAVIDSNKTVRGGIRYTFAPQFLSTTDKILNDFIAGNITVDQAAKQLSDGVKKVVTDAGYLK